MGRAQAKCTSETAPPRSSTELAPSVAAFGDGGSSDSGSDAGGSDGARNSESDACVFDEEEAMMQRVLRESLATAAAQSTATDVAMALASCKDEEAVVQNVLLESASMARSATASGAAAAVDLTKSRSFDTILGPHIRLIVDDRKHGSNKSPEDEMAAFRKKQ